MVNDHERSAGARLSDGVVRRRWAVLAAAAIITLLAGDSLSSLRTDTSYRALEVNDSAAIRTLDRLEASFGSDSRFFLVVTGEVFSPGYLRGLRSLEQELGALDLDSDLHGVEDEGWGDEAGGSVIERVESLLSTPVLSEGASGIAAPGLFDGVDLSDRAAIEAKRSEARANPRIAGTLVDSQGEHSLLVVHPTRLDELALQALHDKIEAIAERHERSDFRIAVTGVPSVAAVLNRVVLSDAGRTTGLSLLILIVVLGLLYRHPLAIIGPVAVVALSVIWTLAAMARLSVPITAVTTILPSFLVCVGVGDALHIQTAMGRARVEGNSTSEALRRALSRTAAPVVFTTLTTCAGLLSFWSASLRPIREFGLFAALGTFLALMLSLTVLPALLSFVRRGTLGVSPSGTSRRLPDRLLAFCRTRNPAAVLWVSAVLVGVGATYASHARVNHDPLDWLPPGASPVVGVRAMDAHLAGGADIRLLVEPREGRGLRDLEVIHALSALESHILAYRDPEGRPNVVRRVFSVLDVVREAAAITGEGGDHARHLPARKGALGDLVTFLELLAGETLRPWVSTDASQLVVEVRTSELPAHAYEPLIKHVDQGIRTYMDGVADVYPTGVVYNNVTSSNSVVRDLLKSFGIALLVISLLMPLVLRDLGLSALALLPNLAPLVCLLGVMGATGTGIDMANLLVASIAIGVSVDDTIHFLHRYRTAMARANDVDAAISDAFDHSGRAMLHTSLLLAATFATNLSAELASSQRFGGLIALVVLFALAFDLLVLPALLRVLGPSLAKAPKRFVPEQDGHAVKVT